MKVISVVGARPNFMKIAPLTHAIDRCNESAAQHGAPIPFEHLLVHSGQHYDDRMSAAFFDGLNIPRPDIELKVGSGSHAEQVGHTMIRFEKVLDEHKPDWVVVVGDVNATCACSVTAKKLGVKVAHIEAGLRSFDLDMPEEINRLVTDRLSDLLFATDRLACENLRREGVPEDKIVLVGNLMIDTLHGQRERAAKLRFDDILQANAIRPQYRTDRLDLPDDHGPFAVVTLHRPSNVDRGDILTPLVNFFMNEVAREMEVVWPVHPRTRSRLHDLGLWQPLLAHPHVYVLEPIGYHEMLKLNLHAQVVLTDSGGLQEECCVLGTHCLTLRWNTERPITLADHGGLNRLVGNDVVQLRAAWQSVRELPRQPFAPPLWDGKAADRVVAALRQAEADMPIRKMAIG